MVFSLLISKFITLMVPILSRLILLSFALFDGLVTGCPQATWLMLSRIFTLLPSGCFPGAQEFFRFSDPGKA